MSSWRAHLALLVLALCSACARCSPPPPPSPAPVARAEPLPQELLPAPPTARVAVRMGVAEIRRKGAQEWSRLTEDAELAQHDVVRTAFDGEVEITLEEVKIRVYEDSEVSLQEVEARSLKAEALGRIEGEVADGRGTLEIKGRGSDAVLRTDGGRFAMTADGRGIVAVASVRGQVKLASQLGEVTVLAGEEARMTPGQGPTQPRRALGRLLLKVDWPGRETRQKQVPVQGKVRPGSRVWVQGRGVVVKPDGTFESQVPLVQGPQQLAVTAIDVLGRRKTQQTRIRRDDRLEVGVREKPKWSD